MLFKDYRQYEDDYVVNECPKVEHLLSAGHNELLNLLNLLRVILEPKSFVLVMD